MNGGLRRKRGLNANEEEINPLEGAINIVDAFLVFVCALIIALVINWNIDPARGREWVQVNQGRELPADTQLRKDLVEVEQEGQGLFYEKIGSVYKDPETGKMFLLTED